MAALAVLLTLAALPLAQAEPPAGIGSITLSLGDIMGLVQQDGKGVVPYAGNVTVAATVSIDCGVILYEFANKQGSDVDHFHVQPADDKLPPWLLADEFLAYFPAPAAGAPAIPVQECSSGSGSYQQTVQYPFGVAADAPGGVPLTLNLTANVGDDAFSEVVPLHFAVQFHPAYTLTPSLRFPAAATGNGANFTLAVKNTGNGPAMVMFQDVKASAGTVSGLADTTLPANASANLAIRFTGPTACWATATVNATAVVMPAAGGATSNPTPLSWTFTHSCSATGATTKAKKSPAPGFLMAFAVLALAGMARRRR